MKRWEDKVLPALATTAVNAVNAAAPVIAQLAFDGRSGVPVVSAKDVTLLFVGKVEPLSEDVLKRNPELRSYPLVELAPLKQLANGTRVAPLVEIASGLIAFGPSHVDATLESPAEGVTLLRCKNQLAPGHYALASGNQYFEVVVQ